MLTLRYKFKGERQTYTSYSACLTILWDECMWKYHTARRTLLPGRLSHRSPNMKWKYSKYGKYFPMEDIEWVEYTVPVIRKPWFSWFRTQLRKSEVSRYITFMPGGGIRYRFKMSDPKIRVLFVVSVLRYAQEQKFALNQFYQLQRGADWAKGLSGDEMLAVFSARHMQYNAHGVYQPSAQLNGFFHVLPIYMSNVLDLNGEKPPMSNDAADELDTFPKRWAIHYLSPTAASYYQELSHGDWVKFFRGPMTPKMTKLLKETQNEATQLAS